MPDNIKIIQDISLLYELSLSVGSSLDPRENCHSFLRTLISRKSLNFGSIWLNRTEPDGTTSCELFYIHPQFREAQTLIVCSQYILHELSLKPYISISSQDPHFEEVIHEKKVEKGAYAIFRLGDLGFLKLFAANRLDGFTEVEMAQLKQVVDKLKVSLDGSFAHIQLKEETENRLLAQRALEESENKLRRIIDSSLDAVVSANDEGLAIEWNAQAEKMFGYTRQEVIGKRLRDLFIPKRHWSLYQTSFEEYLRTTNENLINKRYEIKSIRKNGTEFTAELSVTADKSDKNILFVGFLRDITEQRKAKLEIEQARMRLEILIASLQTGICLEDENRRIALANKSFCNIFGIPLEPEQLIGYDCTLSAEQSKHLFQDPEGFINSIDRALKNRVLIENEVLLMANGQILERNFIPLFAGDKYEGHLWQYRDITERQSAQQAIQESEEKYRGVLDNMELGLLEVDTEDTILRTNNAFCQMLGFEAAELIGRNAGQTLLPEVSQKEILARNAERRLGLSSVYEIQLKRKNGELIWGVISGAPLKNAQGQIVGSIGIQFDLTERKKLETDLAEAKLVADRARMAERQFLTHMSHEIRTPINAVIGMTHLLQETNPDPVQKDYLNSLRFSADSLLDVVDNILDLSKIDAGEIEFEQKPFDLGYLVKSLLQTFQFKIAEKQLEIINKIDPAIENLVIGDPTRLNQILTNLLGNALKFTEKGVIKLTAKLKERETGHYLIEFRVHDTGIGIAQDKLETIFEYFKQANVQINRKFGGTGLGLTIVKQLIEMQGGSIHAESELGKGADFIFTLRFGDSGLPLANQEILPDVDASDSQKLAKGLHFLVVEDNLMNQTLICKTIQSWEGTFVLANNGVEALKKTAFEQFDVILMDIHMPMLDGFEATLAIRNDEKNPNKHVPIIALTAAAMSDDKRKAFDVGMNAFLTKPIAPKLLQEHILRSIKQLRPLENTGEYQPMLNTVEAGTTINLSYLMDLSNGDVHFVRAILEAFLSEVPVSLQDMELLVKQNNWDQVSKLAHKLKPNFAMLGLKSLQEQALYIEVGIQHVAFDTVKMASAVDALVANTRLMLPLLALQKNTL
jgi:PAS domain S-box-containing protein